MLIGRCSKYITNILIIIIISAITAIVVNYYLNYKDNSYIIEKTKIKLIDKKIIYDDCDVPILFKLKQLTTNIRHCDIVEKNNTLLISIASKNNILKKDKYYNYVFKYKKQKDTINIQPYKIKIFYNESNKRYEINLYYSIKDDIKYFKNNIIY